MAPPNGPTPARLPALLEPSAAGPATGTLDDLIILLAEIAIRIVRERHESRDLPESEQQAPGDARRVA